MEVTKAEIDAVLDAQGRFVWTPNALTLDGQKNIPCDLQDGESLLAFLRRHVPGIESGAWSVTIGGAMVPFAMWGKTYPKHGMHIACRAAVGKQVLQLVAVAVLSYFTMGAGAAWIGSAFGVGAAAASAIGMGMFVAGSILINKVLGPKVPKPGEGAAAAKEVFSLRTQRNSPRPYEPFGVLWGEMRVTPDLANQPYAWFIGDDQFLSVQLLGGVNVYSVSDLAIGDTPLSSYQEVETYFDGFAGHTQQTPLLYSNVDSLAGGQLVTKDGSEGWVTRTTSEGAVRVEFDVEGQLFYMNDSGNTENNSVTLDFEIQLAGSSTWELLASEQIISASQDTVRRSWSFPVPKGQHSVRVRSSAAARTHETRAAVNLSWVTLRTVQEDTADYSQCGRIAIKIRATGQISGALDTVRATFRAKPMPIWNGAQWVTATNRANGLSNPGAILLQTLRGIWHDGKLQFGFGMSDEQIDIEGLKAFMLYCQANGYTYDKWITSSMSLQDFCQEVALAGMGEFSWTDGSRPTAVFVSNGQPISAVVNMANMLKASFSVDYALSNAADGIEYQYVDRDKNFETVTLRVAAPGITTSLNPARVTGDGVTTEAHAARMARYHLAQSLYQFKTINYAADIEHLDYRRLSVLSVSHDLTQWGFGGRVLNAKRVSGGAVQITLDEVVPPLATPYLGLRLPGDRDYRVFSVQALTAESDTLKLLGTWPAGVALPGEGDNPMDTLWCYDFKATPGYRVRVTGIEPEHDLKGAKVSCVPEGPEFWDYVINGTYAPAPSQSSLPQLGRSAVKNLRVTERVNVQGDTEWFELEAVWDTEGDYDHAQVWAGRDGAEMRMVDGNAPGSRSNWRIDGPGEWLVEVRPFNRGGQLGQAAAALYITTLTARPPRNVDSFAVHEVAGGLRRFAWQYVGDKPPALAGVQIRYTSGDVALSTAMWESMTPLGQAADVYKAQFETTRPEAGLWTFGIRAIDTAGQLSPGVLRVVKNLGNSFEQVQQPDITPPPAPTGVIVTPGLATVMVAWDAPDYEQGHGHARTEVWAATTNDRAGAVKAAEGVAGPVSFSAEPATTYYVWARHVTNDGVAGDWAGPVSGETGQNPEKLLETLQGQIDDSHLKPALLEPIQQIERIDFDRIDLLNEVPTPALQELQQADLTRIAVIDRIDKAGGPLGKSLLDAAAGLETASQIAQQDINTMAENLLQMVLTADETLERLTDAGIVVDPVTGQVRQYALEATQENVTQLEVLLDALAGQISLKATTAYVDGKIAEAVLSPADLLLYEGLDTRLVEVVQTLDSINGSLTQKANQLELTAAMVRLTSAENTIDALSGQIALRVTREEYEADQTSLTSRLNSAELTLNALDVPSIQATVHAASSVVKDSEKLAETLLQDILTGEANRLQAQEALAFARTELSAAITEGLQAEAAQRTQLSVQFGQSLAAVQQTLTTLTAADVAEAQARLALASQLEQGLQAFTAALALERTTRADADSAEVLAREQMQAQLEGVDNALLSAIEDEEVARVNADEAEAEARRQLAVRLDNADSDLQAAVVTEAQARADAVTAEANQRQLLQATVEANRTEGLNAVDAAFAALSVEESARTSADTALGIRIDQVQAAVGENAAAVLAETQARADAVSAEANQRQLLQATVEANRTEGLSAVDAAFSALASEESARTTADTALGVRIDQVQATVGDHTAAISAEQSARADAVSAEAQRTDNLVAVSQRKAETDAERNAEALLQDIVNAESAQQRTQQSIAQVRSEASVSLQEGLLAEAQQRDLLQARINGQEAALQAERLARADALSAEARQREQLAVQVQQGQQTLAAQIQNESRARADALSAEAVQREQLAAQLEQADDTLLALIESEESSRVSGDQAEAEARQTLAAQVSSNHSAALAAAQAASDAAGSKGKVIFGSAAPAAADRLSQNLWIDTTDGANTPKRWNGTAWAVVTDKAATDAAAAAAAAQLTATNALAAVAVEQSARVSGDQAEASARQTLQATVEGNRTEAMSAVDAAFAALSTEQSVRAGETGYLGALYTVKMELAGNGQRVAGGLAIAGTSSATAGPTIDFGILANRFFIAPPAGSGITSSFQLTVQTTPTTAHGATTPAGLYVDSAYINNVTALWGRFGTLVADSVQATAISASQLTLGDGTVGGTLKSWNFVEGSSGWRLRPDGAAEFSGATVRGTIYASAGQIGPLTINGNGLNAGSFWGYSWPGGTGGGFHLGPNGMLFGNPNTGRYLEITAGGNLYAPGFSIENGNARFSGTLTAAGIVNTSHIVPNAVSSGTSLYQGNELSFTGTGEYTVMTASMSVTGGSVVVMTGFSAGAGGSTGSGAAVRLIVRLRRNGTEVRAISLGGQLTVYELGGGAYGSFSGMCSLPPLTDYPGVGVHTYTVTVQAAGMGSSPHLWVAQRGISMTEFKR